jgi:transcriptional regulator with XRE-family HTH domain
MSNPNPDAEMVGSRVRGLLAERKLSQSAMAARLGISKAAMSRRIAGEIPFNVAEIGSLAALLDVPASRFFEAAA